MNPFDLAASELMIWGLVAHLVADWPLQNHTMATRKTNLRDWPAYVHAGIHAALLALVFGWVAAPLALVHLIIDTRVPVVWWSKLVRQTQPANPPILTVRYTGDGPTFVGADIGTLVRFETDQVFHIACIAVAALAVGTVG